LLCEGKGAMLGMPLFPVFKAASIEKGPTGFAGRTFEVTGGFEPPYEALQASA
jgi:hypothetical protein